MLIRVGHAPWRRGPRFCPAGPGRGWIGTGTGTGIGIRTGTGSGSGPEPPSAGQGGGGRAVPTGEQRAGLGAPLQRCPRARCAPAVPGAGREWLGCSLQAACCSWKEGEGPRGAARGTAGGTAGCRARGPHPGAASRAAGCAEPGSGRAGSQPGPAWGSLSGAGEPPAPAGSLWPEAMGHAGPGGCGTRRDDAGHAAPGRGVSSPRHRSLRGPEETCRNFSCGGASSLLGPEDSGTVSSGAAEAARRHGRSSAEAAGPGAARGSSEEVAGAASVQLQFRVLFKGQPCSGQPVGARGCRGCPVLSRSLSVPSGQGLNHFLKFKGSRRARRGRHCPSRLGELGMKKLQGELRAAPSA